MVRKHWPVLFTIMVLVISIILGIVASHSADAGVAILIGVISWMFLFPLAGALLGGWYGWRVRSPFKWLLAPATYAGVILYLIAEDLIAGSGSMDIGSSLSIGSLTGIACLAVELVSSVIAWLAGRKHKEDDR